MVALAVLGALPRLIPPVVFVSRKLPANVPPLCVVTLEETLPSEMSAAASRRRDVERKNRVVRLTGDGPVGVTVRDIDAVTGSGSETLTVDLVCRPVAWMTTSCWLAV